MRKFTVFALLLLLLMLISTAAAQGPDDLPVEHTSDNGNMTLYTPAQWRVFFEEGTGFGAASISPPDSSIFRVQLRYTPLQGLENSGINVDIPDVVGVNDALVQQLATRLETGGFSLLTLLNQITDEKVGETLVNDRDMVPAVEAAFVVTDETVDVPISRIDGLFFLEPDALVWYRITLGLDIRTADATELDAIKATVYQVAQSLEVDRDAFNPRARYTDEHISVDVLSGFVQNQEPDSNMLLLFNFFGDVLFTAVPVNRENRADFDIPAEYPGTDITLDLMERITEGIFQLEDNAETSFGELQTLDSAGLRFTEVPVNIVFLDFPAQFDTIVGVYSLNDGTAMIYAVIFRAETSDTIVQSSIQAVRSMLATVEVDGDDDATRGDDDMERFAPYINAERGFTDDGIATIGSDDAPIIVAEFSDFGCPHCRDYLPSMRQLIDTYAASGEAQFWYVPMTFVGEEKSELAYQAAYCAGEQGAFWQFHEEIFAIQERNGVEGFTLERFENVAYDLGLDDQALRDCVTDQRSLAAFEPAQALAQAVGVLGVPILAYSLDGGDTWQIMNNRSRDEVGRVIETANE